MKKRPINVGNAERTVAGVLAAVLIVPALRKRSPLLIFSAGCLIYRALSGHCFGYEWTGISTCKLKDRAPGVE